MIPTLDIPALPAPVRVSGPSQYPGRASTAAPLPTYPSAPVSPTAPKAIKPFPLVPSDWWDGVAEVEFQFENTRCAGWRGADKLNLRRRKAGAVLYVTVTLEELCVLCLWGWDNK